MCGKQGSVMVDSKEASATETNTFKESRELKDQKYLNSKLQRRLDWAIFKAADKTPRG